MVATTRPNRWRDADLSPLHLGEKVEGVDRAAQVDCVERIMSTLGGESLLTWLRLDAAADLLAAVAPDNPSEARSMAEHRRMLDPRTRLAANLATEMDISRSAGNHFLDLAEAVRTRIPQCGLLLRDGVVSPRTFSRLVFETEGVVDPVLLAEIDDRIAEEIRSTGQVATNAVGKIARRIVLQVDAEGARCEREAAKKSKGVRSFLARGGMAVLEITDSAEQIAMAEAAVETMVEATADPSTSSGSGDDTSSGSERDTSSGNKSKGERSADVAIGLLTGKIGGPGAKVVVHVVAGGSTLEGGGEPGHLDGHGPIDAETVRDIANQPETVVRPLDLTDLIDGCAQAADPYRPTAACETVVRALFGTCSWPGCSRPASRCQLDHVTEFNHRDPAAGGATCWCNLNPKCVFHHLLKTFGEGWLDDQVVDAHGHVWTEVTTPYGRTKRTRAANTWLLPDLGLLPCRHGPPIEPGEADRRDEPVRSRTRTESKHAYRMSLRAQNRRNRAAAGGEAGLYVGPPAF